VESLFMQVKKLPGNISRATVYNTLELLLDSDLLTKHKFGKSLAQYEKSFQSKQHDHLICMDCEKVFEFCDPRIQQIQTTTGELLNFNITHHSLNFYGKCSKLIKNGKCEYHKSVSV